MNTAPPNEPRFPPEQVPPQPPPSAPPAPPVYPGYPGYASSPNGSAPRTQSPYGTPPPSYGDAPPPAPEGAGGSPPGAYGGGAQGQGQYAPPYGYAQYAPPYAAPPYAPPYGIAPPDDRSTIGPERVPWRWYDLLIAGFLFIIIAALSFANSGTNSDTATRDTVTRSGMSRDAFLIVNLVSSAFVYGLVLFLVWWRSVAAYRLPWSALGVRRAPAAAFWLMIPVWLAMMVVATLVSAAVNQVFFGGQGRNPQIESITGGGGFSWVALVCAVLSAGVIAPVVEELFFRGMLYGWLRSRLGASGVVAGIAAAVALDALIFATVHGIGLILPSIFVVGVALALVYERTKSVLVSITLHSLFNTVQVAAVFISLAAGVKLT